MCWLWRPLLAPSGLVDLPIRTPATRRLWRSGLVERHSWLVSREQSHPKPPDRAFLAAGGSENDQPRRPPVTGPVTIVFVGINAGPSIH
jgi:hypothetical protein